MRKTVLFILFLGLVGAPRVSRAIDVRLEIAPLVMVPMGPFLDNQLYVEGPVQVSGLTFEATALSDVSNGVGGGISVALLLGNFEFRYELGVLPFDQETLTYLGFSVSDITFYLPSEDLGLAQSVDLDLDPILIHNVGIGYRFVPFEEWVVQPYVPFGLGFSVAQIRNTLAPMYGFYVQTGIGAQWDATDAFRLGLEMRYNFGGYKAADVSIRAITKQATGSVTTDASALDAVIEDLHLITVRLHASYKF